MYLPRPRRPRRRAQRQRLRVPGVRPGAGRRLQPGHGLQHHPRRTLQRRAPHGRFQSGRLQSPRQRRRTRFRGWVYPRQCHQPRGHPHRGRRHERAHLQSHLARACVAGRARHLHPLRQHGQRQLPARRGRPLERRRFRHPATRRRSHWRRRRPLRPGAHRGQLARIATLLIYYFVLKFGESVHTTDHRDRKEK
jgi:hypothetical protein